MTFYSNIYQVQIHDNRCYISVRSDENRVDTFSFSKKDISSLVGAAEQNIWMGSGKISIKISSAKNKATLRIDKGHSLVHYGSSIHDAQKLLAQIEDVYFKLADSEDIQEQKDSLPSNVVPINEAMLEAINAIILRQNQMLLHEITMKLKGIKGSVVSAPAQKMDRPVIPHTTKTFIPSNIGNSLIGKINTKEGHTTATVDATELAKKLKNLKDTKK